MEKDVFGPNHIFAHNNFPASQTVGAPSHSKSLGDWETVMTK